MNAVVGVAVFHSWEDEDIAGSRSRASLSIPTVTRRGESPVVFRHHHDPVAKATELGAQLFKRPASVV
jgi:hypothetical protein